MRALSVLLIIFLLIFCNCGGSGTETEGFIGIMGTLVDGNGRSVANVKVTLYNYDSTSVSVPEILDETSTDNSGNYTFKNLHSGIYTVTGKNEVDGTVVFIFPVFYDSISDLLLNIGTDTLFAPGTIRGCVTIANKPDSSITDILVYIPGTSYNAHPDPENHGEFVLNNIPRGTYRLYYSTPKYLTLKSIITVAPGDTTQLECQTFNEYNPENSPPAPTLKLPVINGPEGTVNLSWNKVNVSDLRRYFVYRETADFTITQIGTTIDTTFVDTLFGVNDTLPIKVWYLIKSQDNSENVSLEYSNKIIVVADPPCYYRTRFFNWEIASINNRIDSLFDTDTLKIKVSFQNKKVLNEHITWAIHRSDSIIEEHTLSSYSGNDSVLFCYGTPGTWKVFVSATDCTGAVWVDSASFTTTKSPYIRPSDVWVESTPIDSSRMFFNAVHVNSSIYIIGGAYCFYLNGRPVIYARSGVEKFGSDSIWQKVPDLPRGRYYYGASVVDDIIYIIGGVGNSGYALNILGINPVSDTSWQTITELPYSRTGIACCVYAGKIYITGGSSVSSDSEVSISDSIHIFDPESKTIIGIGKLSSPRAYHQIACINEKMYVFGGYDGNKTLSSMEIFDLRTNMLTTGPSMSASRMNFSSDTLNGKIYAVGGYRYNDKVLSNVEVYDPSDNSWKSIRDLPYQCQGAGCVSFDNTLYIIGGSKESYIGNPPEPITKVEVYYP
ncbi:MAG: hypothetical protein GX640_02875 [Fibrobacter sp.]|nr:hypothetical protein [Fibrobacter sp.]